MKSVGLGLVGLGTVGSGVIKILAKNHAHIAKRVGGWIVRSLGVSGWQRRRLFHKGKDINTAIAHGMSVADIEGTDLHEVLVQIRDNATRLSD